MKQTFLAALSISAICSLAACTSAPTDPRAAVAIDTSSAERPEVSTGSNIVRRAKSAHANGVKQMDKDSIEIRRGPTNTGSGN